MRGLACFIQENPVQVGPSPPKSAQVLPGPGNPQPFPPRFSQEFPEPPQNRRKHHPGSPRTSRNPHKIVGIHQFPGRIWENLGGPKLQKLVRGKVAGGWPATLTHNF